VNRRQLKAWKAASRKVFLGARKKMVGKPHLTKPSTRQVRQAWKKSLKREDEA
jgi:hypothetical protein